MKPYYEKLRELREGQDLKQSDVALVLGTTQQVYSRYENGIFHKAGCCLLYGYLKISLAAGYARRAIMMKLGSICSSYHFQDAPETFRHKENRLRELQMEISRSGYAKHSHNLKILN